MDLHLVSVSVDPPVEVVLAFSRKIPQICYQQLRMWIYTWLFLGDAGGGSLFVNMDIVIGLFPYSSTIFSSTGYVSKIPKSHFSINDIQENTISFG